MKEWMNTREVAKYLKVNEKLVYDMVTKRGLPGTRVTGKWLFDKELVDIWLGENMENTSFHLSRVKDLLLVAGSNDILLEETLKRSSPAVTFFSGSGSRQGLQILKEKKAHLSASHLLDPEKEEYNIPFLSGYTDIVVVNFAWRYQGILAAKGNPRGIRGIEDLARNGTTFINRQAGSGTRVLLDVLLKKSGVSTGKLKGYETEVNTHLEVGLNILRGEADAGLGIRAVAGLLGLEFIPVQKERFDLLIPKVYHSLGAIQNLVRAISSDWFRNRADALGGYDTRDSGKIIHAC